MNGQPPFTPILRHPSPPCIIVFVLITTHSHRKCHPMCVAHLSQFFFLFCKSGCASVDLARSNLVWFLISTSLSSVAARPPLMFQIFIFLYEIWYGLVLETIWFMLIRIWSWTRKKERKSQKKMNLPLTIAYNNVVRDYGLVDVRNRKTKAKEMWGERRKWYNKRKKKW